jgi:hypothetical protein
MLRYEPLRYLLRAAPSIMYNIFGTLVEKSRTGSSATFDGFRSSVGMWWESIGNRLAARAGAIVKSATLFDAFGRGTKYYDLQKDGAEKSRNS